jgi:hypothetical protein
VRNWLVMHGRATRFRRFVVFLALLVVSVCSVGAVASVTSGVAAAAGVRTVATTVSQTPVETAEPAPTTPPSSVVTQIDDPASSRTINRIIAALIVLGGVLLAVTVWFWIATKPLHPALESLDLMSSRRWARGSEAKRAQQLERLHGSRGALDDRIVTPERRSKLSLRTEGEVGVH